MAKAYGLTKRTAEDVVELTRKYRGRSDNQIGLNDLHQLATPIVVKNVSDETIPPFACMKVTDAEEIGGIPVISVDKPNNDGGPFLFNGPIEISNTGSKRGAAQLGPIVKARYSTGTPAVGETWGPTDDWACVRNGQPAVRVFGGVRVDGANKFFVGHTGMRQLTRLAKADASITYDNSGTVSVYKSDGTDTTDNVTAHLTWMHGDENVSANKELLIRWIEDRWVITGAECE